MAIRWLALALVIGCGGEAKPAGAPVIWGRGCDANFVLQSARPDSKLQAPATSIKIGAENWTRLDAEWVVRANDTLAPGRFRIQANACGFTSASATGIGQAKIEGSSLQIDVGFDLDAFASSTPPITVKLQGPTEALLQIGLELDYQTARDLAAQPNPRAMKAEEATKPFPIVVFDGGRFDPKFLHDTSPTAAPFVAFVDTVAGEDRQCEYRQFNVGTPTRVTVTHSYHKVRVIEARTGRERRTASFGQQFGCPASVTMVDGKATHDTYGREAASTFVTQFARGEQ